MARVTTAIGSWLRWVGATRTHGHGLAMLVCAVWWATAVGCAPVVQQGEREIRTPDVPQTRGVISPPIIVEPLLTCGQSVTVKGFGPDATIDIFDGATRIGGGTGTMPWGQTFPVAPQLASGRTITAVQTHNGSTSGPSAPATVKDHTEVYPNGLPKPQFPFLHLYDCGVATYVDQLPPGGTVRVFSRDPSSGTRTQVGQVDGVEAGQSMWIGPAFVAGREIKAQAQICTVLSPESDVHVVQPAPSALPAPEVTNVWDQGRWISVHKLVNGAQVKITKGGQTIGGGGAPSGHVRFWINPALAADDVVEITQTLCNVTSPPVTVTVPQCSALPPVHIVAPSAGDTQIKLVDPVLGSQIFVLASGHLIGNGGGDTIQLIRPLNDGEPVVVVQKVGTCTAQTSYTLDVGRGLNDPGNPGFCGGGRPNALEYGHDGDPARRTTDVSSYFNSPASSVSTPMNAVPLHGRVRFPSGPGPFPLVLIVHGNHSPTEASDPGYDYLLDHLASHCMIAVSVDENFLNGNVSGEMDARAIVLLRHLQLWREWNQTPGHPFFTKVDMQRVGLAGHSRGGEAVVAARHLNTTLHNVADPAHNFNFGINGLYAIAPVDGQFDGGPLTLTNANYYMMHGSHDGDVSDFQGHKSYDRALPVNAAASRFKGLLYVYGANHGQWNTVWGTGSESLVTGTTALNSGNDQRAIGKTYMAAFFLSALMGQTSYNALFGGEATFVTLPGAAPRVFQYQDPKRLFVNHYEEDNDPATGSFAGVTNSVAGVLSPYEDHRLSDRGPPFWGWQQTDGVVAAWRDRTDSAIVIAVPAALRGQILSSYPKFAMRVGQVFEDPADLNAAGANKDMVVQAWFGSSPGPEIKVSDYATLRYPERTNHPSRGNQTKTVMQTVRIPWTDLLGPGGAGRLNELTEIRLKFNRHPNGLLVIDEVQLTH
jgi:hypothetical protein